MRADLSVNVRRSGNLAVIDLSGAINGESDATLDAAYRQLTTDGAKKILLNFGDSGECHINSAGISVLFSFLNSADANGQAVFAIVPSDHMKKIFQITGIDSYMTLVPSEESVSHHVV